MIFIPAIDLKDNCVSKANAGNRKNYRPLKIENKDFSNPKKFITTIVDLFNIKKIYIADLDSLENRGNNWQIIGEILNEFSNLEFLIDSGFSNFQKINFFNSFISKKKSHKNFKIVIGSECFENESYLRKIMVKKNYILSLDYNKTKKPEINLQNFKNRTIILMFMDQVGGRGINWKEIKNITTPNIIKKKDCYIAGGVRYAGDIKKIKLMGFKGIIISSFIHNKIKKGLISPFS